MVLVLGKLFFATEQAASVDQTSNIINTFKRVPMSHMHPASLYQTPKHEHTLICDSVSPAYMPKVSTMLHLKLDTKTPHFSLL